MSDVFHEQLVKRVGNSKNIMVKALTIVACIIVLFIALSIEVLALFIIPIIIAEVVVVVFIFRRQNIEFEYIVTNSELDIDKVINMSKRKHLFTIDAKSIVSMTKYENIDRIPQFKSTEKTVDASSGVHDENTQAFIANVKGKTTTIIFDPNEDIYKALKIYLRGKIVD